MNGKVAKRLRKQEGWVRTSEREYLTVGEGMPKWYASTQNSAVVPAYEVAYLPLETRRFFYTALPSTGRVVSDYMRRNYKQAKKQYKESICG